MGNLKHREDINSGHYSLKMIIYKNLVILGTSHISIQSIKEVKSYLDKNAPKIVALELDKDRFIALTNKNQRASSIEILKELGPGAFLINKIGQKVEKELGKLVGVTPGAEMLEAIKICKEKNINIALIDQNIRITLKKLSKVPLKEKLKLILDIFTSPLSSKNKVKIDLRKVPEQSFIIEVINKVKERYPSIYKVLIEERNKILAKNLYNLNLNNNEGIFVIVGAGHIDGLVEELKKMGY
ncbi:TraB/GumN family protein [Candidatus Woesearchaeota archaeon]|nr:TraB/GumN family protein [Candidatus Woesearchaeota archaeon]